MPKRVNLPLSYSVADFSSERFMKLRIKVMHSGLNLNNSNFGMEAIEKAKPSIANIPLLAFIKKEDGSSNEDFAGHEFEIKITESGMKYVYLGRPIGIVPETNNYEIVVDEESGKTFVEVDAYVWKNYANSALEILESNNSKKVSMEVMVQEYDWQGSYVDILDYSYTGIALLGDGVQEAMIGAKAEVVNFSETKNAVSELMFELAQELNSTPVETIEQPAEENFELEDETATEEVVEEEFEVEEADEVESTEESSEEFKAELTEEIAEPTQPTQEFVEEGENVEPEATQETEDYTEKVVETDEDTVPEASVADLHSTITRLESTLVELQEKVKQYEQEKIELEFSDIQDEPEYSEIVSSELSFEEKQTKLFALRGKQKTLSPVQGLVFSYLSAVEQPSSEPSWAHLVKKSQ